MKTGARISRFGRPQKETQQDVNSIPTEIAKFIPKHSPKRLKPKEFEADEESYENEGPLNESQLSSGSDENTSSGKENIPLDEVSARPESSKELTDLTTTVIDSSLDSREAEKDEQVDKTQSINEAEVEEKQFKVEDESTEVISNQKLKEEPAEAESLLLTIEKVETADTEVKQELLPTGLKDTEANLERSLPETEKSQPETEIEKSSDFEKLSAVRMIESNPDDSMATSVKQESMGNQSDSASDTDSALGSASSHKDLKEENFCPGDILWGSFSGGSWYPCMVYPDDEGNIISGKSSKLTLSNLFL